MQTYNKRRGFRVLIYFSGIVILGIILIAIIASQLSGCAPVQGSPSVVSAQHQQELDFIADPSHPNFVCAVVWTQTGFVSMIDCEVIK